MYVYRSHHRKTETDTRRTALNARRRLQRVLLKRITKFIAALTGLALAAGCAGPDADIVIENVTIIDAIDGKRAGMDVMIRDGEITAVAAHSGRAPGAMKIDGENKFLIPGLWDAHVHLTFTPGLDHETFFPLSLAYGVTSMRDTGGHLAGLASAREMAANDPLTPDLYISGPLIDGSARVYDGRSRFFPDLSVGAETPEDAVRIVNELADAGVHLIKAYEMLPQEVFAATIDAAARRGLPVAAHAPLSMTALDVAHSGANDLQHLRNLEMGCADAGLHLHAERQSLLQENDAPDAGALRSAIHRAQRTRSVNAQDNQNCDALIDALAANGVFQTPTLTVVRFATRRLFKDPAWRETFDLVPPEIGDSWRERSTQLTSNAVSKDALAYDAWAMAMIKRMHDRGVRFMAGTDAPIGFLTPGASLHEELKMLVEAGLSPLDAIEAATLSPAAFFGREAEIGAVQESMIADLVLLNADPLVDISNTTDIHMVFKNGRPLDRRQLDALKQHPSSLGAQ